VLGAIFIVRVAVPPLALMAAADRPDVPTGDVVMLRFTVSASESMGVAVIVDQTPPPRPCIIVACDGEAANENPGTPTAGFRNTYSPAAEAEDGDPDDVIL
jgi:hypothetical protein